MTANGARDDRCLDRNLDVAHSRVVNTGRHLPQVQTGTLGREPAEEEITIERKPSTTAASISSFVALMRTASRAAAGLSGSTSGSGWLNLV